MPWILKYVDMQLVGRSSSLVINADLECTRKIDTVDKVINFFLLFFFTELGSIRKKRRRVELTVHEEVHLNEALKDTMRKELT